MSFSAPTLNLVHLMPAGWSVRVAKLIVMLGVIAYPVLVYGGLRLLEPRWLALAVGAVVLVRELQHWRRGHSTPLLVPLSCMGAILLSVMLFNERRFLLFVPALFNAALFVSFAWTLLAGPSMVETLARRHYGHVPPEHLGYCRRVTGVWSAFFLTNSAVTVWLALYASIEMWTVYTGFLAYVLAGMLFAAEMTYRAWRFRTYRGDVTDAFFRRLFPPAPAP